MMANQFAACFEVPARGPQLLDGASKAVNSAKPAKDFQSIMHREEASPPKSKMFQPDKNTLKGNKEEPNPDPKVLASREDVTAADVEKACIVGKPGNEDVSLKGSPVGLVANGLKAIAQTNIEDLLAKGLVKSMVGSETTAKSQDMPVFLSNGGSESNSTARAVKLPLIASLIQQGVETETNLLADSKIQMGGDLLNGGRPVHPMTAQQLANAASVVTERGLSADLLASLRPEIEGMDTTKGGFRIPFADRDAVFNALRMNMMRTEIGTDEVVGKSEMGRPVFVSTAETARPYSIDESNVARQTHDKADAAIGKQDLRVEPGQSPVSGQSSNEEVINPRKEDMGVQIPRENAQGKQEGQAFKVASDPLSRGRTPINEVDPGRMQPGAKIVDGMSQASKIGRILSQAKSDTAFTDQVFTTMKVSEGASGASSISSTVRAYPSADLFATDILDRVSENIRMGVPNGSEKIRIQLYPESLGKLDLHLTVEDEVVKLRVFAQEGTVKDLLLRESGALREILNESGLKLEEFTVSVRDGWSQHAEQMFDHGTSNKAESIEGSMDSDERTKASETMRHAAKPNALVDIVV